jgi:predicted ATPase/class 3 adenylate cyclase
VTLLFTDMEGSTRLLRRLGPEYPAVLNRHRELLRAAVAAQGGVEVKTEGDGFFFAFPAASSALFAAVEGQRAIGGEPWSADISVKVRMGLHTGDVSVQDGDYVGLAVHQAARIAAAAHGGQILCSELTAAACQPVLDSAVIVDLGLHRLKDFDQPQRILQVSASGLAEKFPALRTPTAEVPKKDNLPLSLTSFVGRDNEVEQLCERLRTARLVTVTGAGGSGKSRLAVEAASRVLGTYVEEAWLLELASLADPELVVGAAAGLLRVSCPSGQDLLETLIGVLGDRRVILVLDNCEHLLAGCARLVDTAVRGCPNLVVLTTSREPLRVPGEHVYRLVPLEVPPAGTALDVDGLGRLGAVRLFADRAASNDPTFVLDETSAPVVASICRRLDGMPLAVELAAARLPSLSLAALDGALGDRLGLLTQGWRTAPRRHQTLRGVLDWSYELLEPKEQVLLCDLSVFRGGWSLEAAQALGAARGQSGTGVAGLLANLVDKSLVYTEPSGGELHYGLHQIVLEYAADKLAERAAAEVSAIRLAHGRAFARLVATASQGLQGRDHDRWLARLDADYDNVRAALAFLLSAGTDIHTALDMAVALREFWIRRGLFDEGIQVLDSGIARLGDEAGSASHAAALVALGRLRSEWGDLAGARGHLTEALDLSRALGDDSLTAEALTCLSLAAHNAGDRTTALSLAEEAVALAYSIGEPRRIADGHIARAAGLRDTNPVAARADLDGALAWFQIAGDDYGTSDTLGWLAGLELRQGNLDAARAAFEEAVARLRGTPDERALAYKLNNLGLINFVEGDHIAASESFVESLLLSQRTGLRVVIAKALLGLAACAEVAGHNNRAALLYGSVGSILDSLGEFTLDPILTEAMSQGRQHLIEGMGAEAFERSDRAGREMSLSQAIALGLTAQHLETPNVAP